MRRSAQGGAADIAMLAMLMLQRNKTLKDLGFTLLMQARPRTVGVYMSFQVFSVCVSKRERASKCVCLCVHVRGRVCE